MILWYWVRPLLSIHVEKWWYWKLPYHDLLPIHYRSQRYIKSLFIVLDIQRHVLRMLWMRTYIKMCFELWNVKLTYFFELVWFVKYRLSHKANITSHQVLGTYNTRLNYAQTIAMEQMKINYLYSRRSA